MNSPFSDLAVAGGVKKCKRRKEDLRAETDLSGSVASVATSCNSQT